VFYLRQVNCLTQPERSLVELFRVLVFGVLVNPMPETVYNAVWATATWGADVRRGVFEGAFSVVMVTIDDAGFAVTLNPEWFVAYNEAVEAGDAPITDPCPCDSF
jgi:hypothetical protein